MRFHVPKTDVFLDQALHSFQLKLLRSKISLAADTHQNYNQKRGLYNHLLSSVSSVLRNRVRNHVVSTEQRLYAEKLERLLDCKQFRKLEKSCDNIIMKKEKELNKKFWT